MIKNLRLNKQEKNDLGDCCHVDVGNLYVFVWGGGNCEAAFPIRHWEEVKKHIDSCLKKRIKK